MVEQQEEANLIGRSRGRKIAIVPARDNRPGQARKLHCHRTVAGAAAAAEATTEPCYIPP